MAADGSSPAPAPGLAPPGSDRPVLSVVIACLDAATTLPTQLEALAGQPCPVEWELLLCDNGSTDASIAVAETYRSRIPRLRILDASAHRGAGPARNFGVGEALGQWVAFCDADDEVAGDWLASMCRALTDHRFVAGSFEPHRLNDARVLHSRPMEQQQQLQSTPIGTGLPHAGGGNMGMHRRDFLAVGGFDPLIPWLEDTDFSWRAQLAGVPLVFRPEIVVHVRLRRTFRSMFVQGRQYGLAYALLEERYGPPPATSAQQPEAGGQEPATATPARGLRSGLATLFDHVIAGKLAWRVGWVVGHRSRWRPAVDAAPPAASPIATRS